MTHALQPFFTMRAKRFCRSAPSGVVCSASSITAPSSYMTVPASPVFIPQWFSIACVMKADVVLPFVPVTAIIVILREGSSCIIEQT